MKRGKPKLLIDKSEFQGVVNKLEASHTFVNPSELWKAVEETEWAKSQKPRPLKASVAYLRAKELGIVTITKAGKRGGTMTAERIANMRDGRSSGKSRSEKMSKFKKTFDQMRKVYPQSLMGLIDKAEKGSLKAAVILKCMECGGFVRQEVKKCVIDDCPLYPHRGVLPENVETDLTTHLF